jgi:hypothetical protein
VPSWALKRIIDIYQLYILYDVHHIIISMVKNIQQGETGLGYGTDIKVDLRS